MYVCIYIYIYRERERETPPGRKFWSLGWHDVHGRALRASKIITGGLSHLQCKSSQTRLPKCRSGCFPTWSRFPGLAEYICFLLAMGEIEYHPELNILY